MVGVIASYVRTALVAIVAGVASAGRAAARRRGRFAAAQVAPSAWLVLVLAGGYGATLLAGDVDPMAKDRAQSLANPFTDDSVRTRLKTWDRSLDKLGARAARHRRRARSGARRSSAGGTRSTRTAATSRSCRSRASWAASCSSSRWWGRLRCAGAGWPGPGRLSRPVGVAALDGVHSLPGPLPDGRVHRTARKGVRVDAAGGCDLGRVRAMNGRLNIAALALAVALLAVGPLALTLARAPDYRSSAAITLDESNPSSAYLPGAESLVAKPLQVSDLQRQVAKRVDWFNSPNDLDESVSVRERRDPDGRAFVVTARGPSPKEAQELAQVTAVRLRDAAEAAARFTQPLQLQRIRKALSRTGAPDAERDELLRRRTEIAKSVRTSQPIFDTTVGVATLSSRAHRRPRARRPAREQAASPRPGMGRGRRNGAGRRACPVGARLELPAPRGRSGGPGGQPAARLELTFPVWARASTVRFPLAGWTVRDYGGPPRCSP